MDFRRLRNFELKYEDLCKESFSYINSITDPEHGMSHIEDVVYYTELLVNSVKTNSESKDICYISAFWHDVGRSTTDEGHEELSAVMLRNYMEEEGIYPKSLIDGCYNCIKNHKWNMTPETGEGLILKDADKLAFVGLRRWDKCLENKKSMDVIIQLLPSLRNDILYFKKKIKEHF